ncbi:MAG: sulfate ABC transporter permease subunit CysT [Candidatus Manganitrophus sp.]|nr:MAG: sulfate ABC transporter permease subunit CysT [Candidatus Manganitrophus sp.]
MVLKRHSVLPGFGLALGFTLLYLSFIVLIPLSALFLKTATLDWSAFWDIITAPRVLASYRLSLGASLIAALLNAVFGLLVAWVLVRYAFPGKRLVDALVDLPFALPTAVAGIALTALYAGNGWIGQCLEPLGIKVAYTPLGIVVALTFIGLPFVVRTVQPVLEDLQPEFEEAATTLGANRLADLSPGDLPDPTAGAADRLRAGLRARGGRIRLGDLHRRQHADGDGDHAAADHHQARAVRLRRRHRDRGRDAGGVVRPAAGDQRAARAWSRRRQAALNEERFRCLHRAD